jgi:rhomboid protease GluP
LYVASRLLDVQKRSYSLNFHFLEPSNKALAFLGSSGAWPVFASGSWWTIITAPFLHGSLFHIGFNLGWVNYLAEPMNRYFGFAKTFIIFMLSGIFGALASSLAGHYLTGFLQGSHYTVGASGAVFGMMGALMAVANQTGSKQLFNSFSQYILLGLVFGFFMPRTDNWGHLGGLVTGYLLAYMPAFGYKGKNNLYHFVLCGILLLCLIASLVANVHKGMPG